jgi:hypothetical protein
MTIEIHRQTVQIGRAVYTLNGRLTTDNHLAIDMKVSEIVRICSLGQELK